MFIFIAIKNHSSREYIVCNVKKFLSFLNWKNIYFCKMRLPIRCGTLIFCWAYLSLKFCCCQTLNSLNLFYAPSITAARFAPAMGYTAGLSCTVPMTKKLAVDWGLQYCRADDKTHPLYFSSNIDPLKGTVDTFFVYNFQHHFFWKSYQSTLPH